MVDVIFDAAPLGFPNPRTRLFNAVFGLLKELSGQKECSLYLASSDILPLTMQFLNENPLPGILALPPHGEGQALGASLASALDNMGKIENLTFSSWFIKRLSSFLEKRLNRQGQSLKGLDLNLLKKAQIYHTTCHPIPHLVRKYPLRKILTIYDFLDLESASTTLFHRTLDSLRPSDILITPTEYVREQAVALLGWPRKQIFVVPLGVREEFKPRSDMEALSTLKSYYGIGDSAYFIAVGRPTSHKNYERLISAFLDLVRQNPSFSLKLVLVGPQNMDDFSQESIIITGYISDEDLAILLSGATAFVRPSLDEGSSLPLIEAMACGTPVICSDIACLPEVADEAAFYIKDPLTERSIYEALYYVYMSQELQTELRAKSLARAELFSWKKTAEKTLAIYNQVA